MNENVKIEKYLITENGDVLSTRDEIINYLNQTSIMLKAIRSTSKFANEFKSGELSKYYEIEENLKLITTDNKKLDYNEVYEWIKRNNVR